MTQEAQYPHGHHPSVLRSHRWRTVSNSAAYLLPHIKPTHKILDVGCGPGTISCDFANQVPQGSVTGIDSAESIVSDAKRLAQEQGIRNVSFKTGNVFSLPFEDDEFDIVHAHQVLQHVADPAAALREMKRVAKQGTGIVAVRDMSHFLHYPEVKELKVFTELFWEVARRNHAVPGFGCMLKRFTREAGFKSEDVTITAGTWCFCTKEDLEWWCGMWADRVLQSEFHDHCIKMGLATEETLQSISKAWSSFVTTEDAWYTVVHGELIARVT